MRERTWSYAPIPLTTGSIIEEKLTRDAKRKALKAMENIPYYQATPDDAKAIDNPFVFQDPDTGEYVKGLLEVGEATRQQMKGDYARGFTATDASFRRQMATRSMGGRDLSKYEGTILDLSPTQNSIVETKLAQAMNGPEWNLAVWDYNKAEDIPIYDNFVDGAAEDLLNMAPPEGWSPEEAIKQFEEADPELYNLMALTMGGPEGIKEVVKDSRNPVEFFYDLNNRQQLLAITESIDAFDKRSGWTWRKWKGFESFMVNGIIDDPDMAGSLALSVGLAGVSGGTSLIGGLIFKTGKGVYNVFKLARIAKTAQLLGKTAAYGAKYGRHAQLLLPENLGPTLIRSVLFRKSYKQMGWAKKHLFVNRLGDSVEGSISGGIAEYFNQRRKRDLGLIDDISWSAITTEALFEAAISPIINPIFGTAFKGIGAAASLPGYAVSEAWFGTAGKTKLGTYLTDLAKRTVSLVNPDLTVDAMNRHGRKQDILAAMNNLLADDENLGNSIDSHELLPELLETLRVASKTESLPFLDKVVEALDAITANREDSKNSDKMTGLELAINIANHLATKDADIAKVMSDGDSYAALMQSLSHLVEMNENAKEAGMTIEQYKKELHEKENYFEILPKIIKEAVYEKIGGEKNKGNYTDAQLHEKAAEFQLEVMEKIRQTHEKFDKKTKENKKEADSLEKDGDKALKKASKHAPQADPNKKDPSLQKLEDLDKEAAEAEGEKPEPKPDPTAIQEHIDTRQKVKRTKNAILKIIGVLKEKKKEAIASGNETAVKEIEESLGELGKLVDRANEQLKAITDAVNTFLAEQSQSKDLIQMGEELAKLQDTITEFYNREVKPFDDEMKMVSLAKRRIQNILNIFNKEDFAEKYPNGLKNENLTRNQQEGLVAVRDMLKGGSAKTYLTQIIEGETINAQQLNDRVNKVLTKRQEDVVKSYENSGAVENWKSQLDEHDKELDKYNVKRAKWQQEQAQKEIIRMTQVVGAAETQKERQRIKGLIKVLREAVDKLIEGQSDVSMQDLANRLPRESKLRQELLGKLKENPEVTTIGVSEIKERLDSDFEAATKKALQGIKPGDWRSNPRYKPSERMKSMFGTRWSSEVSDGEILDVDWDPEWLNNPDNTTIGEAVKQNIAITIEKDKGAISEWLARMSEVAQTVQSVDADGTIATWRLLANMPDYLWEIGVPLHIVFKEAMVKPTQETMNSTTNVPDIEEGNLSSTALSNTNHMDGYEDLPNIRWNLDKVIEILTALESMAASRLTKPLDEVGKLVGEALAEDMLREGATGGLINLNATLEFTTDVIEGSRDYDIEQFKALGYIIEQDTATGYPTEFASSNESYRFVRAVKTAIDQRVTRLLGNGRFRDFMRKKVGIDIENIPPNENQDERLLREAKEAAQIRDYIIENLEELNEVPHDHPDYIHFTIEGFGNGQIAWAPAETVGFAIVDTFAEKHVPEKNRLTNVNTGEQMIANEETLVAAESVAVQAPLEGQLNQASKMTLTDLSKMVENHKLRLRVREILKKAKSKVPLTKEEKQALYNSMNERRVGEGADPVGEEMDLYLVPPLIGGHAEEQVITRDEAKEFMIEMFLDMAHISHSINQDAMTVRYGSSLRFRNTETDPQPLTFRSLNLGYDTIVPWGQIGEVLALEEMSPHLEGMSRLAVAAHLKYVREYKERWENQNPGKEWDARVMLDPSNYADQTASGLMITKLLSLIGSDEAAVMLDKIRADIEGVDPSFINEDGSPKLDKDGNFMSLALEDAYVSSGLRVVQAITEQHSDNEFVVGMGEWNTTVFQWLRDNEITDTDSFREKVAEFTEKGDEVSVRKAKAIREFFKVPVMRRLYGGGLPAFKKEFMGRTANSKKVIVELQTAFGIKISQESIENTGKVFLGHAGREAGHLLDAAMGFGAKTRRAAVDFLSIKRKDQVLANDWLDIIQSFNIPNSDSESAQGPTELKGADGEAFNPLDRMDRMKRQLNTRIEWLAARSPGGNTAANRAKLRKKYQKRIDEALAFMEKVREEGQTIDDGTDNWKELQRILHGGTKSWETIRFFQATNILNSSAYQANMDRMKETADLFGFTDFDADEWMGLEDHIVHHLFLPTQRSHRSYHKGPHNPNGIFAERVAVDPDEKGFENFVAVRKEEVINERGRFTKEDFEDAAIDYFSSIDPDQLGMWDLKDNIYATMSREELDAELDRLMDLDQMMYMASHETLDKTIFPNYTIEDSKSAVIEDLNRTHFNHTRRRFETPEGEVDRTLKSEQEREMRLFNRGERGRAHLTAGAKISGGLRNPRVAMQMDIPHIPYNIREYEMSEIISKQADQELMLSTVEPKGLLGMMPRFKRVSYFSRGIPALQRVGVQRQINKVTAPLRRISPELGDMSKKGVSIFEDNTLLKGWRQPWERDSLPQARPITVDEMRELGFDDSAGRKAAKILRDMRVWAANRPEVKEDIETPAGLLYWYVVREIEETRKNLLNTLPNYDRFSENQNERAAHARRHRMRWLEDLHSITHFSRDIKTGKVKGMTLTDKARELAVDSATTEADWLTLLTSQVSEDNPHGTAISAPTKLHKSLRFILPRELVVLVDSLGSDKARLTTNELQMLAQAIQSTDFSFHLLSVLYKNKILPSVLKEFTVTDSNGNVTYPYRDTLYDEVDENGVKTGRRLHIWKTPHLWEQYLDPAHMDAVVAEAIEYAAEHGGESIVFDTLIEKYITSDPETAKDNIEEIQVHLTKAEPAAVGDRRGSRVTPALQRNSFFPELTSTPTELVGKGQLALTPDKALELFALLESHPHTEKQKRAAWANRSIGYEVDPRTGERREIRPVSRRVNDATGHSEADIRDAELLRSTALERVTRTLGNKRLTKKVIDRTRSKHSVPIQVVDLDLYSRPQHRYGLNAAWVESFISPITEQLGYMQRTGIDKVIGMSLREEIQTTIQAGREANSKEGSSALAKVMWMGIMLQMDSNEFNSLSPRGRIFDTFIGEGRFTEEVNARAFKRAKEIVSKIKQLAAGDAATMGFIDEATLISAIREWAAYTDSRDDWDSAKAQDYDPMEDFLEWANGNLKVVESEPEDLLPLADRILKVNDQFKSDQRRQYFAGPAKHQVKDRKKADLKDPEVVERLAIGKAVDTFVRDVFAGRVKEIDTYQKIMVDEDANLIDDRVQSLGPLFKSQRAMDKFKKQVEEVKAVLEEGGNKIISDEITFFDDELEMQGTTDVLVLTPEGKLRIYDVKAITDISEIDGKFNEDDKYTEKQQYQYQLSSYAYLAAKQLGVEVESISLIPITRRKGKVEVKKINDKFTYPMTKLAEITSERKGWTVKFADLGTAPTPAPTLEGTRPPAIKDGKFVNLQPSRRLQYLINFALGQEMMAIENDSHVEIFGTHESKLNSTGRELQKLVGNTNNFNEAVLATEDPELIRVNTELNRMASLVPDKNIRKFRAMIARLYSINPTNIIDLHLDYDTHTGKPRIRRTSDDKFVVRLGGKLQEPMSDPNIALVFAHELAHMGRMRWIANHSGEYRHWVNLYHSKAGKQLLFKIVKAWHGGVWSSTAEQEYKYYMSDPEEFIAALTSYYLLNDALPPEPLTADESEILSESQSIVGKIMDFVRQHFLRISSVLTNFHHEDPKLAKHVEELVQRTLGWDPHTKQSFTEVQNKGIEREMFWDKVHDGEPPKFEMDEAEFKRKALRLDELTKKGNDRTDAEDAIYYEYRGQLIDSVDANHMMTTGIKRIDYFVALDYLQKRFPGSRKGQINLTDMLNSMDTTTGDALQPLHFAAALHYVVGEKCNEVFGHQFRQGMGVAQHWLTATASNFITGGKDPNKISRLLAELTVGKAGANFTWNGPHPLVVLITQLINDDIATSIGQYTNVDGTPSVVSDVINKISMYQDTINSAQTEIGLMLNPIFTRLFGHEPSNTKSKEAWNHMYLEIMRKIEDPSHEFDLGELQNEIAKSDETFNKIVTEMQTIADTMDKFMSDFIVTGQQLNIIPDNREISHKLPFKLTKLNLQEEPRENFIREMSMLIRDNIIGDPDEEFIDPLVMYTAKLLPRFDLLENLVKDITELPQGIQKMVIHRAAQAYYNSQGRIDEDFDVIEGSEHYVMELILNPVNAHAAATGLEFFRAGIISIMKDMAHGKLTRSMMIDQFGVDWTRARSPYVAAAQLDYQVDDNRIQSLDAPALDSIIPNYIHYSPGQSNKKPFLMADMKNALSLHMHNIINRASVGLYHPHDMWSIPSVVDAAENSDIRPHLILSPDDIMDDMKKGKADAMFERQMMVDRFGVDGTVADVITLFEEVADRGPGKYFHNLDGTQVSLEVQSKMREAAQILRGKHQVTRGIKHNAESPSATDNFLSRVAPGLTRTVFGGNLALATYTVEGMMNAFQEGLGKGNIVAAIRGIFAPIWGLSPEVRKRVGRDLVHTVEALTKGYVPDHEMPANAIQQDILTRFFNKTGRQAMRPAQHMLKTLAMSRAISARNFITDNIMHKTTRVDGVDVPKLKRLVQLIEENPLGDDPKAIKARMREAGFSVILDGDLTLISYMLRAGMLKPEAYASLEKMIVQGLGKEKYYSPSELFSNLLRSGLPATHHDYQLQKDMIAGLRFVEKRYIEEVLVAPNAFDVFTPMVTKSGEVKGTGTYDTLFEIFRRYPMLFVSQHVYRKANRLHPIRYSFGLMSMIMLDMVYMIALRLAMGATSDEIMDEFEDNPTGFTLGYAVRLPVLGRYMGLMAEVLMQVPGMSKGTGRTPGSFVPVGALMAATKGVVKTVDSHWNDKPHKLQDTINAARVIPLIGDRLISLGLYTAAGDSITRRNVSSGGGKSSRTSGSIPRGHYGVPSLAINTGIVADTRTLLEEFANSPLQWGAYEARHKVPFRNMKRPEVPEIEGQEAPTPAPDPAPPSQPAPAPATAPQAEVSIVDQIKGQQGSSGKLADAFEGEDLARYDMPRGVH